MVGDHGQEGNRRKEIRRDADRRRASAAQRTDPQEPAPAKAGGTRSARQIMKARILLKADTSEAGEAWSDGQIVRALETSLSTVYRARQQLVEEGFAAVLCRKPRARPSIPRIFDGEGEARSIALACSEPPKSLPRRRPGDARAGRCACWRRRWWSCISLSAPATTRLGAR